MTKCVEKGEPWAQRLSQSANRGVLSHAVILTGHGEKAPYARYLAATFVCRSQDKPCLTCRDCRKVMEDIHPDVIWVRDDEHKDLSVDTVRAMRQDVYIRPNEGERKVYIFEDCEKLTTLDQDILLKIVEEGPPYAAFIFCTDTSRALLETIRSRCTEYRLPADDTVDIPFSAELIETLCSRNPLTLCAWLTGLENQRLGRENLKKLLQGAWVVCAEAQLALAGKPVRPEGMDELVDKLCRSFTPRQLEKLTELLARYGAECNYNVGEGHLLGALAAQMEGVIL